MLHSRKPRKVAAHLRWSFVKMEPGSSFPAWIAGPMIGVDGHWDFSHKPCLKSLTDGKLPCKYCQAEMKLRWMGYLPLYDAHLRQIVVGIGPDMEPSVSRLECHATVRVKKGRRPKDPIIIEHQAWTGLSAFASGRQAEPQNLWEWLLQLWNKPELKTFLVETPPLTPIDPAHPPVDEAKPKGRKLKPEKEVASAIELLKNRIGQWRDDDQRGNTDSASDSKPSKNGTH